MLGRGGSGEGANYGKAAHVETVLHSGMRNFDISFLDGLTKVAIAKQLKISRMSVYRSLKESSLQ
tara:strand:- start:255 stop:449 length:195 start_codon:yes stop_codon:yes gene_type:complete